MDQAARMRQWLSEEGLEERYQRERVAYRAMRKTKGADGPASPATLPRMPSLSKKATKGSLPPPPTALPPEEPAASSSTDAPLHEHGAAVPLARRDSGSVPASAPPDALEGVCVSSNARTTPPATSSFQLPGLSVGVVAHEPQRTMGPMRPVSSLSKKAGKRPIPQASPSVPNCGCGESERGEDILPADASHMMSTPRPECQRRLSGFL